MVWFWVFIVLVWLPKKQNNSFYPIIYPQIEEEQMDSSITQGISANWNVNSLVHALNTVLPW